MAPHGFRLFGRRRLVAPPLMWSETLAVLHERMWRGEIGSDDARAGAAQLASCPVRNEAPDALGETAWEIAGELGWAKTYDAEYLALARLFGAQVITLDRRLRREAERTGLVITPGEM